MPDVAEVVLNRCMVTIKKQNGTYVKKYYYEFLDDYHNKSHRTRVENIKSDGRGHHNWVQHAFKKEAHAFQVMIDNKRIELLNHPLATQLLTYKWRSYGIFIYYINLISYLLFLGFLTGFTLSLQNPKTEECMPRGNGKKAFLTGAAVLIVTFSMIRIAVEAFQIYYRHFRYFLDVENWMELYLYSSAIAFVGFGLADDCQCPHPWQWEFGAVTLLIAWLNLVLFLKKFPLTGVYVLMFIHIMNTILRIILLPILFVISFGLTFYMLFYRPPYKSIGQHILYEENGNKHVQAVPKLCGLDHRLSDVTCDSHQHQVLV
ncbi:transient receptor potential cation channel subfamily A member 1 homolog [Dysidea avara]|uniref:transient receptor potential cation channel subfamily A member 1 homolog n=1 Tax=Dysidea avara TaxID=196820 RepID=UPI0033175E51